MSYVVGLRCSICGKEYDPRQNLVMCDNRDLGRLDILYDYERVKEKLDRREIEKRGYTGVWRYEELLPVSSRYASPLREGATPLIRAKRLGEALGVKNLYLKDDTRNPTSSFKDRAMAVGAAKAVEIGVKDVVIASSGNAAASLAAYSSSLNLRCHAFVPEDVSMGKVSQLLLFGAEVIRVKQVEEGKDPTVEMMVNTHIEWGWYPCPSFGPFNPYQVEGPKTMAYEIIEQLGWETPSSMFVPTGSGCLLTGIWKGLNDFQQLGMLDGGMPRLFPVQPSGNQPLVRAINSGKGFNGVEAEKWPRSIASGLLDPYPWDGDAAIEATRKTGGAGVAVDDEEIIKAVRELARYEGVFAEPSGAVGIAALKKMLEDGKVDKDEVVVVLVTGSGLKEVEKIVKLFQYPPVISPSIDELRRFKTS